MDTLWIIISTLCAWTWESTAITNRGNPLEKSFSRHFRHIAESSAHINTDWEIGLREATNQALLRERYHESNLRNRLIEAPLIGKHDSSTLFGDIVILARGQLYITYGGNFLFVQDQYQNDCDTCHNLRCNQCKVWKPDENEHLVALWTVKRLRHRSLNNGHYFELEYIISPINPRISEYVTQNGHFNYGIPGHIFVVKNDKAAPNRPDTYATHTNAKPTPYNYFKPAIFIGVTSSGEKRILHSYPGFYTSFPVHPTYRQKGYSTNDPKEIELYRELIESLATKTSTTQKVEAGPHKISLNGFIKSKTNEISTTKPSYFTFSTTQNSMMEIPTRQLTPLTKITFPPESITTVSNTATYTSMQYPQVTFQDSRITEPSIMNIIPTKPTTFNNELASKNNQIYSNDKYNTKTTNPVTTIHYYTPIGEEDIMADDISEMKKITLETKTTKPVIPKPEITGSDFLFPKIDESKPSKTTKAYKLTTMIQDGFKFLEEPTSFPTQTTKQYHINMTTIKSKPSLKTIKTTSKPVTTITTKKFSTKKNKFTSSPLEVDNTKNRTSKKIMMKLVPQTVGYTSNTESTISNLRTNIMSNRSTINKTTPESFTSRPENTMPNSKISIITKNINATPTSYISNTYSFTPPAKATSSKTKNVSTPITTTPKSYTSKTLNSMTTTKTSAANRNISTTSITTPKTSSTTERVTPKIKISSVTKNITTTNVPTFKTSTTVLATNAVEITTPKLQVTKTKHSNLTGFITTSSIAKSNKITTYKPKPTEISKLIPKITTTTKLITMLPTQKLSTTETPQQQLTLPVTSITITTQKEATNTKQPSLSITTPLKDYTVTTTQNTIITTTEIEESSNNIPVTNQTPLATSSTLFETIMTYTPTPTEIIYSTPPRQAESSSLFETTMAYTPTPTKSINITQKKTEESLISQEPMEVTTENNNKITIFDSNDLVTDTSTIENTYKPKLIKATIATNTIATTFNTVLFKTTQNNHSQNTVTTTVQPTASLSTLVTTEKSTSTTRKTKQTTTFVKPSEIEFDEYDIFGATKLKTTPSKPSTAKEIKESELARDLFGSQEKPGILKTDTTTAATKIIFSNFFVASTTPMPKTTEVILPTETYETTTSIKPLTSQSYATSISFKINKNNGSIHNNESIGSTISTANTTVNDVISTVGTTVNDFTVQNGTLPSETKTTTATNMDTKKTFDHLALQLINHARSIDYLSTHNNKVNRTKYKRRKIYIPKNRRLSTKKPVLRN